MSISTVPKRKHWDGASNLDTFSQGDIEDTVKKKKRKMINLDVMYMGSGDVEGTPKRKKYKVNSESQDMESDPMIPKSKKSGGDHIEKSTDRKTYTKKKRKDESHQDDAASSMVLHQKYNEKIKKAHKAKNSKRLHRDELFTEETPCRENTDLEGRSKERKKKKVKKDCGERLLDNSSVEDLTTVHTHRTNKRRKDGDLQGDGFTEEVNESVDQSETAFKKKKKKRRKEESHQEAEDIAANNASSSSVVLYLEENEKIKKSLKAKDTKKLYGDEHFIEETAYSKLTDPEGRSERKMKKKPRKDSLVQESSSVDTQHAKKKKKWKVAGDPREDGFTEELFTQRKSSDGKKTSGQQVDQSETAVKKKRRKGEPHQETQDIAATDWAPSIVYQEKNKKIKKSHKAKDTMSLHGDECLIEETAYSKLNDPEGRSEKKKKKSKKDLGEKHLGNILVDELSIVDIQHTKKKKKKWKGSDDLQKDGFTEELFIQRKSSDGKETSEQVDQSETAVKKKNRKGDPHKETEDIAADDGAPIVLYREQNEKKKKSHKAKDTKGRHGDGGLPKEASYTEHADITDKQSLKKKKDRLLENGLVEELSISETQHDKKKKKKKISGGLQDDGFIQQFSSHRKPPDGSDALEQMDKCLDQVEKPIKKKKKRKEESHQEAEDIAVDDASSIGLYGKEPSYSELKGEDRPSRTKKKKSKKVHLECPLEDSLVEELLDQDAQRPSKKKTMQKEGGNESHRQHSFTETTEQVVETVEQTEVHVKKAKNKKHLDRREKTSDILAEEMQPEVDQSAQSQVVESDGNVEDPEQTSTSGRSRPQTCASTDTVQSSATQYNRPATSDKKTKAHVKGKAQCKLSVREQDLKLIKEHYPLMRSNITLSIRISRDLKKIKLAKEKGIPFRSGPFTIEEDELIKKNLEKFMSEAGIHSPLMLFHPYYFPEQLKSIRMLKTKFRFAERLADGLYRCVDSVVGRGAFLYNNCTNSGRFSHEEVKQLKRYHKLHGDNYVAIAKLMSRTVMSSQRKIQDLSNEVNTGPWQREEVNRLIAAVKEFVLDDLRKENDSNEELVTIPKISLYRGIKWLQIEKKVVTRNWSQCKTYWFNILAPRMNNGVHPCRGALKQLTMMKIIQWMHDSNVKEYCDMKWDKLCDYIGNVPPYCIQIIFNTLKTSVENWKEMRLHQIVDYLYNVTLPRLEYEVSDVVPAETEKKDKFLISEMFREYLEDE